MKISRNGLGFISMLTAGLLLAGATVLMPSALTFGQETDTAALGEAEAIYEAQQRAAANQPAAPSAPSAPAPPAAPIDAPSGSADGGAGAAAGTTDAPAGLPSAGSGGYLNSSDGASMGYMLIALGATLMGSGSLVWAYSRRNR